MQATRRDNRRRQPLHPHLSASNVVFLHRQVRYTERASRPDRRSRRFPHRAATTAGRPRGSPADPRDWKKVTALARRFRAENGRFRGNAKTFPGPPTEPRGSVAERRNPAARAATRSPGGKVPPAGKIRERARKRWSRQELLHRNGFFPERLQQDSKPATISPPPPQKPRTILLYLLPSKKDGRRQIFQERVDEKENACGKELGRVQRNERVREKGKVDPFWRTPLLL